MESNTRHARVRPPSNPSRDLNQRQTPSLRIAAILILHQLACELRLIREEQMRKLGDIAVDFDQTLSDFLRMGQNQRLLQIVHGPDLSLRRQLIKWTRSADEIPARVSLARATYEGLEGQS